MFFCLHTCVRIFLSLSLSCTHTHTYQISLFLSHTHPYIPSMHADKMFCDLNQNAKLSSRSLSLSRTPLLNERDNHARDPGALPPKHVRAACSASLLIDPVIGKVRNFGNHSMRAKGVFPINHARFHDCARKSSLSQHSNVRPTRSLIACRLGP